MTTRRTKGFASLDLVLPVAPHYRTDPQVLKDVETMRTNATSRWAKDDYTLSSYNINDNSSKISALARPKVEILRASSPTLKRLVAARVKLDKYANSISRTSFLSRQSIRSTHDTPYPIVHEKQSSTISQPVHVLPQSSSSPPQPPLLAPPVPNKQIKSQSSLAGGPLDKITYEKVWSRNGNMKQKCSLEIWLPKPSLDDDDGKSTRTITPEITKIEKQPSPIPTTKSRRSSIVKITTTTTITNIETKSLDEISSKKSETIITPHVYHYGDYIMDLPDERPRSSKSVTTVKSDGTNSIKSLRRQQTRSQTRRQSISTNHSNEEILRFSTVEVPTSAKTLSINTKSASPNRETKITIRHSNPSMINELMQKYSLIKKNHQELTQAKLQLEKPNNDLKINSNYSPRTRPPPIPESTSIISSDHPTVSVKKLLIDTSSARSPTDNNTKLLERRSTPRKQSHSDIYPQLRIFSLANQRQHRQSSGSISTTALLPTVTGKKSDDTTYRTLQRSKTLDVVLDIPNPIKVTSRVHGQPDNSSSKLVQRSINETNEHSPSRFSKRSTFSLRSEQQKQQKNTVSIIPNSESYIHHSSMLTSVPTNKVLIHFNHSNHKNTDRNYFVPE